MRFKDCENKKMKIKCPVCNSSRVYLLDDDYATLFRCNNCGEMFSDDIDRSESR